MINVVVGPMFSGKTTTMIKKINESILLGNRVLTIQWESDNRSGNTKNHNGLSIPGLIMKTKNLGELQKKMDKYDLICIDDAHFFTDLLDFSLFNKDKNILVCGLDTDYLQNSFTNVTELSKIADTYVKLQGVCGISSCNDPSIYTIRTKECKNRLVPGNLDLYLPVCANHIHIPQM